MAARMFRFNALVGPLLRGRFFWCDDEAPLALGQPRGAMVTGEIRGKVFLWNGSQHEHQADPLYLAQLPPEVEAATLHLFDKKPLRGSLANLPLYEPSRRFEDELLTLNHQLVLWERPTKHGWALLSPGVQQLKGEMPSEWNANPENQDTLEQLWAATLRRAQQLTQAESDYFGLAE